MALKQGTDLTHIAEFILGLVRTLRDNPNTDVCAWCELVLNQACRQVEVFLVPEVSVRAQQKATAQGLGNLARYKYADQPKTMGDHGRNVFHWEHVLPVSEMRRRLQEPGKADLNHVLSVLRLVDIAWILKDEDKKLTDLKLRHHRPGDPWEAYRTAEIELVTGPLCTIASKR